MKHYTRREAGKILCKNGFEYIGAGRGSHFKYKRGDQIVVINKNLQEPVFHRIIKENNLNINI